MRLKGPGRAGAAGSAVFREAVRISAQMACLALLKRRRCNAAPCSAFTTSGNILCTIQLSVLQMQAWQSTRRGGFSILTEVDELHMLPM